MRILEYLTTKGLSPFRAWFEGFDGRAAAKVTTALIRIGMGNRSNMESVGGGAKKRQSQDIETAKAHWNDYRARKRQR